MPKHLQAAIIGLGGFARHHHESLSVFKTENIANLMATCDSNLERFAESDILPALERRGVQVYRDYLEMLDAHRGELDFVTIPTPIPLHAPMHRACVERGLAVYLEKPPTLDWRELEAMIEVEKAARFATQVGFNFIVETARQSLKNRLLAGEFGALKRAGFIGCWPRSNAYFTRAGWAGRLRVNDGLILDSCAGNAMAHYVHNLLFWCGTDALLSWGEVDSVESELYRAHPIESFDTVFARGKCGDVEILLGATHAACGASWQNEWFECENARVSYGARGEGFEIAWKDGRCERGATTDWPTGDYLTENLRQFSAYLRGETARPLTTLRDSRPFVQLNDLLFIAAKRISDVPSAFITSQTDARGQTFQAIENVEAALQNFERNGILPSENGVSWSRNGGCAVRADLPQLDAVIDALG